MTQINNEKLLPDTFETGVPAEATASIPYDQLIADTSAVQDAIEWGMDREVPVINDLWSAVYHEHAGGWIRKGGVIIRTTLGGEQDIVIRESEASPEIETLRESVNRVLSAAMREHDTRHNYDRNIGYAKSDHGKNQKRNGIGTGILSTIGSAAIGYSAPMLNEVVRIVAYQPNPFIVAGGAALTGAIMGAGRAAKIYQNYRTEVKRTENPALAPRGEEIFQQLTPAMKVLTETYDPEVHLGDILLQNKTYEMDLKQVKKLLKEPGGPEPDEFEAVLEDLEKNASKEKLSKKGRRFVRESLDQTVEAYSAMYEFGIDIRTKDRGAEADDKEKKGRYYTYNPAELVKQMITDTNGEIWSEDFSERARSIAVAQAAVDEKQAGTKKVKELTGNVIGADDEEHVSGLKLDIENLKKTIDLEVLRLLKLRAQYAANKASTTSATPINDPYAEPAMISLASTAGAPQQLEAHPWDFSEGWPLMDDAPNEEEKDSNIA